MNVHDKHQYYFEKYLRNEMPKDERAAFDEKLKDDAALRMALEYYKLNRQNLLEQLIEEHHLTRRDNRLNKLIFLLISLTGIGLTFNYFIYRNEDTTPLNNEKSKNIFIRYIPFLNWENRSDKKNDAPKNKLADSSSYKPDTVLEVIETLEPSTDGNERLASDQFIADTFVNIWDKAFFDQWILQQTEPETTDSIAPKPLVFVPKDKTHKLLVEFWQSPVAYKGYLFDQHKLVLYGIPFTAPLYIYKEKETYVMVLPTGEFQLIEQPNFIPF